ncbi:MAG: hypothetical protein ACFCUV_27960 [Rivularia sp. (in: cyanobacteria)]
MIKCVFIFSLILLGLHGCGGGSQVNQDSTEVRPSIEFKSKAPADKLTPKTLPRLGTTYEQLNFKAEDAEAIISSKPRPTYPTPLAVLAGNPPPDIDICNLEFSATTQAIFEQCIQKGMNYYQVANTLGFAGKEIETIEDSITYRWGNGDGGEARVTFKGDRMVSKSQIKLK